MSAAVNVGNFAGVIALFGKAKDAGLKFPKIRLTLNGKPLVFSLNGLKSKAPGAVAINGEGKFPNRAYYGRVTPDGTFVPFQTLDGLTDLLTEFASNPARVAKDYGKLTGNCCFCGKGLGYGKEQRSALVGFGPECAENYGLKAEWLAAAEKAEAKASVAPLKLEGPWIGSEPTTGEPTLTVSPAAQATIDTLAESLTKATDAVNSFGASIIVGLPDEMTPEEEAEDDVMWAEAVEKTKMVPYTGPDTWDKTTNPVCFFCEQPSTEMKTLQDITVCAACMVQLL